MSAIRSSSGCRCSARLRRTAPGSALVRELTAAPDLDGWAIVERLLKDLAPLDDRVWLVIDDVHDLDSAELAAAAGAAGAASPAGAAVRARHPARPAAGPAPAAAGGRADRDPPARPALHPGRGPGVVPGGRGADCPTRRWDCCTSGPRAGRPGCGWPRCRWPGTPTRSGSPRSSPAASGRWRSTCWPRCLNGSRKKSGGCCCGPACLSGSAARSPMPSPGARAGSGSCWNWRPPTRSSCRWTRRGPGSATTTVRRPAAAGIAPYGARGGRGAAPGSRTVVHGPRVPGGGGPARPGGGGLGARPPACWPTTGPACS